jgi:hypothetical protein
MFPCRMTAPQTCDDQDEFQLDISGEIESGSFTQPLHKAYVAYDIMSSDLDEWRVISGVASGISPKSDTTTCEVVWNVPISCSYSSPSPAGWPRITLTVYGTDWLNRHVVLGYASTIVPSQPGRHSRTLKLFAPQPSSWYNSVLGWILGHRSRFRNKEAFMCRTVSSKENIKVKPIGFSIRMNFNICLRNTEKLKLVFE